MRQMQQMQQNRSWIVAAGFFVVCALPTLGVAQIQITQGDILALIGSTQTTESDTTGSVTVNVGNSGAAQVWDFSALVIHGEDISFDFLSPAGTPFGSDFPAANFAVRTIAPDGNGGSFDFYIYYQVGASSIKSVGSGFVSSDTSGVFSSEFELLAPLPLTFGAAWNDTSVSLIGDENNGIRSTDFNENLVDAWGTVRLASGTSKGALADFETLRIKSVSTSLQEFIVGGVVVSATTSSSIDYEWIAKGTFSVMSISSQDGETNPNFTDASSVDRLKATTTGIAVPGENTLPTTFNLMQNYPNPFNPETTISYSLGKSGLVELAIFDVSGKKVRTLLSAPLQAGSYTAAWDGRNDAGQPVASGQYIYSLKLNGEAKSKVMVLVK